MRHLQLKAYLKIKVELFKLKPHLAPIKAAIIPFKKNDEKFSGFGKNIRSSLQELGLGRIILENTGNIGKSYRKHDEIGTPLCITVDFETLEDNSVTLRDRDSMKQVRINIKDIKKNIHGENQIIVITTIRSLIFNIFFYFYTIFCCLLVLLLYPFFKTNLLQIFAKNCIFIVLYALKFICGISWEVKGMKIYPKGPCIFAANHQGLWESFFLQTINIPTSSIIKRELLLIPFLDGLWPA